MRNSTLYCWNVATPIHIARGVDPHWSQFRAEAIHQWTANYDCFVTAVNWRAGIRPISTTGIRCGCWWLAAVCGQASDRPCRAWLPDGDEGGCDRAWGKGWWVLDWDADDRDCRVTVWRGFCNLDTGVVHWVSGWREDDGNELTGNCLSHWL